MSTTHTVVGGILGAGLAYAGTNAVNWGTVWLIIASWVISPVLSGIFALGLFAWVRKTILRHPESLSRGYLFYPILVGLTIAINVYVEHVISVHLCIARDPSPPSPLSRFFIIFKGSPGLDLDETPLWVGILVALAMGMTSGVLSYMFLVPILRRRVEARAAKMEEQGKGVRLDSALEMEVEGPSPAESASNSEEDSHGKRMRDKLWKKFNDTFDRDLVAVTMAKHAEVATMHEGSEVFDPKTGINCTITISIRQSDVHFRRIEHMFSYLQILSAVFDSFAHGSNDVANSVSQTEACHHPKNILIPSLCLDCTVCGYVRHLHVW